MFNVAGKTVIVTGGGRGVGRGITRAFARAGANVAICGRNREALDKTADEIRALGGKILVAPGDVNDGGFRTQLVERTVATFGALDGLVNNAGSADPNDVADALSVDEGQWDRVVTLNLKSAFFMAQAAARAMKGRGGSIVNISSRSGGFPCPMTGPYGAAKAGLESLTATMATEWGHLGIRVNALALGLVVTEGHVLENNPGRQKRNIEVTPLRRLGAPDDIGPICVALTADETSWISGTVIRVDGGGRIPVGLLTYFYNVSRKAEAAAGQ